MSLTADKIAKLVEGAKSTNNSVKVFSLNKLKEAGLDANGKELKKTPAKPEPKKPEPKKPEVKKPEPTPAPKKPTAGESRKKASKQEIEDCEKLLEEHLAKAKTTRKWKKERQKEGLPEKKTAAEVLDTAHDKVADNVKTALKKGEGLSKKELNGIRTNIRQIVKVTLTGITDKGEKKAFIKELIEELKKQL